MSHGGLQNYLKCKIKDVDFFVKISDQDAFNQQTPVEMFKGFYNALVYRLKDKYHVGRLKNYFHIFLFGGTVVSRTNVNRKGEYCGLGFFFNNMEL